MSNNVHMVFSLKDDLVMRIRRFNDQMICQGKTRFPSTPVHCVTINPAAADITCARIEGLCRSYFWVRKRDCHFVIPMQIIPGSYFTQLVLNALSVSSHDIQFKCKTEYCCKIPVEMLQPIKSSSAYIMPSGMSQNQQNGFSSSCLSDA